MSEQSPHLTDTLAGLLRRARGAYSDAIESALRRAGHEDIPRRGTLLLSSLKTHGDAALASLVERLGTSKQAASQLIDTLVSRGYIKRSTDPEDRRRLIISLTEQGHHAAEVINEAIHTVDNRLTSRLGSDRMHSLRDALNELADIAIPHRRGPSADSGPAAESEPEATAEPTADGAAATAAEAASNATDNAEPESPASEAGESTGKGETKE
jgi:DNA-binding MarR family transcriptional regulator